MSQEISRLSNGMRVITEHMPGLASANVGVWVEAGARHETLAENGIAHFLEHMAFKGTKTRSSLQIAQMIEDVGGHINAYTSREMTAYYARVLAEDVPRAIEVIGDILRNSLFEPKEIEVERGVILQEIGQTLDTPDDIIFDWLQEMCYQDQALGRSILGPAERVKAFDRAALLRFIGAHYGADRLILSAAGAVDHDTIVAQAEALFGDLRSAEAAPLARARFTGGAERRVKTLEQAHIAMAFDSPSYRDPQIHAAQIYGLIMGGGMSSRLFQEVREKRGLCYTISTHAMAYADAGQMVVYAGTGGEDVGELCATTFDEMRKAAQDVSAEEVARARNQIKAGHLMGLESPSARSERQARMLSIWGYVPSLEEVVAKIDAVDVAAVQGFAHELCHTRPMALVGYGPVEGMPDHAGAQALLRAAA